MVKSNYIYSKKVAKNKLLLFHTLTFKIILLKQENILSWDNSEFDKIPIKIQSFLVKNSFIISKDIHDKAMSEKIVSLLDKRKNTIANYVIYLTDKCNLNCSYCFQNKILKKRQYVLKESMVQDIFSSIKDLITKQLNLKPSTITLFGGEPLLLENKKILEKIFENLESLQIKASIVTNSVLLQQNYEIIKKYTSLISSFITTIDGPKKIHDIRRKFNNNNGTFDIIIENLIWLKNKFPKIRIIVNVLLDKGNINYISELFDVFEKNKLLNFIEIRFGRVQNRTSPHLPNENELPYTNYHSSLLELSKTDNRITIKMTRGSEVSYLTSIYESIDNQTILLPNFGRCMATNPGRYCFYPDGSIYPCTEIAGIKKYAIGTYIVYPFVKTIFFNFLFSAF